MWMFLNARHSFITELGCNVGKMKAFYSCGLLLGGILVVLNLEKLDKAYTESI